MNSAAILAFVSALCAAGLGGSAIFRARRSVAHWSFVLGMAALSAEALFVGLAALASSLDQEAQWESWRMVAMSFLPGTWVIFSFTYARSNYGEFFSKWQMPVLALSLTPVGLSILLRDELLTFVGQAQPGSTWVLGAAGVGTLLYVVLLLGAVVVLMNLERTYRASVGTMRWRIKFTLLGLGVLFAVRAYTSSQFLLFRAIHLSMETLNSSALILACLMVLRSFLRSGHFEVSVYPSQSVLQNSFTMLLAGLYLVIIGVLAKLVSFIGEAGFEVKAFLVLLALVLLTLVFLSERARLWCKQFVSRNFKRPSYDYRNVWRAFTEGTARQVEQPELCRAVVKLVSDIFQVLSVTLWVLDPQKSKMSFAASTSFPEEKAGELNLEVANPEEVIGALAKYSEAFDLETVPAPWALSLKSAHPGEFRSGGNRICVPIFAGGEMFGFLILADRVGGVPFSTQDLDLLKAVGDQAAARLLNIQLSQKLAQSKQLEAFQAMSAFFVHDLKNTASTLSLMLQNLPVHYQDPQFREDALRGISKTVTHINDVISRLTDLRHELAIRPIECDLNELVTDILKIQQEPAGIDIIKELHPLPKLRIDPSQIQKVLTNLVLNAREALASGGRICIETSQRNGWAVLGVADNGCGMTPDFIQRSLFRPFQTTKKRGIGIGMFHCLMIVEAHHGRIEVESQVGKGTSFRVLLPLTEQHNG